MVVELDEKESKKMISQNLTAIERELNSSRRLNYILGALTAISLLFAVFGFLGRSAPASRSHV